MKKHLISFTALLFALTTMPGFANQATKATPKQAEQEQLNQTSEQINNTIKNLKIGDSISYNTADENEAKTKKAIDDFNSACNELTGKNHIKDTIVQTSTYQGSKKVSTCLIHGCDDEKYKVSEDKKSCIQYVSDEQRLQELEDDYKAKKENEQSTANKTLTALTTAATGIGGMELAMGLSEQKADKDAANSMAAYIATMRCTYADGKQVKAGPDEIELPGGNNQQLMNLRAEYFALANDLKERKSALGMQPGIESTEILDKSATGLYDDENIGITSGAYESLYRAQMLGSETDQAKIDEAAKTSKNRVLGGAIAAGAGAVVGVVGNVLINGKLGDKIKEAKGKKDSEKIEKEATKALQACLKDGGATQTNTLSFKKFMPSILNLDDIDCKGRDWKNQINGREAQDLFIDSDNEQAIKTKLTESFGENFANKLLSSEKNILSYENVCTEYNNNTTQYYAKEANGREEGKGELGTLSNNQWIVKLPWGKITGSSICTKNNNTQDMTSFAAGNPDNSSGEYCWCKADSYTKDEKTFDVSGEWYLNRALPTNSRCSGLCASYCAIAIQKNPYKRALILDKADSFCLESAEEEYDSATNIDADQSPQTGKALTLSNVCYTYKDGESWEYSADNISSRCSDTEKGEWNLNFEWGNVKGTSLCSTTKGESVYELGNPETESNNGTYCWCKEINNNKSLTYWTYDLNYKTSQKCTNYCAHHCAYMSQFDSSFRAALLGIRHNGYKN